MDLLFVPLVEPPEEDSADEPFWFCVRGADVAIIPPDDLGPAERSRIFLGVLGGRHCWALDIDDAAAEAATLPFTPLRSLYSHVPERTWTVAGRAVQLIEWDRTHRYCGRCATPTEPSPGERARRCPACGLLAFPRLAPAVIVLIERVGPTGRLEALLARGAQFPLPMYSCLAGFVEPGETLEDTVHREVREEVGVSVDEVRYVASQPWPFPHSLMLGFTARWQHGDIVMDPKEIADANWYDADELPMVPPPMSIARRLIDDFVTRAHAHARSH